MRDSQFGAAQSISYFAGALGAACLGIQWLPAARWPIWTRSKQSSPPLRTITGRNRSASLFDGASEPPPLPAWLSKADVGFYTNEFTRTSFRGGLNWYRIDRNWELLAPFEGLLVSVPAPYIAGDRDPVIEFPGMDGTFSPTGEVRATASRCDHGARLRAYHPGGAAAEVNATMIDFIRGLPRT